MLNSGIPFPIPVNLLLFPANLINDPGTDPTDLPVSCSIVELEYKAVLRQVRNKLASNLQDHPRGISLVNLIW